MITTIGYGTFTPGSWQGKAFTCGYSLPGLLLLGYALSGLISLTYLSLHDNALTGIENSAFAPKYIPGSNTLFLFISFLLALDRSATEESWVLVWGD